MGGEYGDEIGIVEQRAAVVEELLDGPLEKRELEDRLDVSRSTVDRSIRDLVAIGAVERVDDGYAATAVGRVTVERYRRYVREMESAFRASALLRALPVDCDLGTSVLAGAEVYRASGPAPYRPLEELQDEIRDADGIRAALRTLPDAAFVRLCYERIVTDEVSASIVVTDEVLSTLEAEFPRRIDVLRDADPLEIAVGAVPSYDLVLVDRDGVTTAWVIVFDQDGVLRGALSNDDDRAVEWATDRWDAIVAEATAVERPAGDPLPTTGDAGVPLARQGFVELSDRYFTDRTTAPPETAWRAGLDLVEVQSEYSVDRTIDLEDRRRSMTDLLVDRLRDGEHTAVIGPPGSGKSTVCKRVACRWYREGDPVFYRNESRAAIDSPAAVVEALDRVDGTPLLVVEDAARPDARAILEAAARLDDGGRVLVDARTAEWTDPPGAPEGLPREAFETVRMPELTDRDRQRFVRLFERTVEEPVDLSLDRVRPDDADGPNGPDEVVLLMHRLSSIADPLSDRKPTTLRADVREEIDRFEAASEGAVDVATTANLLNAAGVEVSPAHLHALDVDPGTVESAMDDLRGRVLFETDGGLRTVHESWSAAFLEELADSDDAPAARFHRCLSAVLGLAEPERRATVAARVDDPVVERVAAAPAEWVESVLDRVLALGSGRPSLAPLYGTPADESLDLPEPCPPEVRFEAAIRQAAVHRGAGEPERTEEGLHAVLDEIEAADLPAETAARLEAKARRQLAAALNFRGELDAAEEEIDLARERLDDVGAPADDRLRAKCADTAGVIAWNQGAYERALDDLNRAVDAFRESGATSALATALSNRGNVRNARREDDPALSDFEEALSIARDAGLTEEEGRASLGVGLVRMGMGDHRAAERHLWRALRRFRRIGDELREVAAAHNLGHVCQETGKYEAAERYATRAIDLSEETGQRVFTALAYNTRGIVAMRTGRPEDATEEFERALEIVESTGNDVRRGQILRFLGWAATRREEFDRAESRFEESRAALEGTDAEIHRAFRLLRLGELRYREGDLDAAAERVAESRERFSEIDDPRALGEAHLFSGRIARERGDDAAAREHFEAACDRFERTNGPHFALRALRDLADLEEDRGDHEAVTECWERARRIADGADTDERPESFRRRVDELRAVAAPDEGEA